MSRGQEAGSNPAPRFALHGSKRVNNRNLTPLMRRPRGRRGIIKMERKTIKWDVKLIKQIVKDLSVCEKVLKRNVKLLCLMISTNKSQKDGEL